MEYFHIIAIMLVAQVIALISPGPDFALVLKNALLYTRRESLLIILLAFAIVLVAMTFK